MNVHLYTGPTQPATDYADLCGGVEVRGGWGAAELIACDCCRNMWHAGRCVVQCYYDGLRVWCAPGFGCKDPVTIAAKRERERANRSAGQKRRYSRAKQST